MIAFIPSHRHPSTPQPRHRRSHRLCPYALCPHLCPVVYPHPSLCAFGVAPCPLRASPGPGCSPGPSFYAGPDPCGALLLVKDAACRPSTDGDPLCPHPRPRALLSTCSAHFSFSRLHSLCRRVLPCSSSRPLSLSVCPDRDLDSSLAFSFPPTCFCSEASTWTASDSSTCSNSSTVSASAASARAAAPESARASSWSPQESTGGGRRRGLVRGRSGGRVPALASQCHHPKQGRNIEAGRPAWFCARDRVWDGVVRRPVWLPVTSRSSPLAHLSFATPGRVWSPRD